MNSITKLNINSPILVLDLECTCDSPSSFPRDEMEIIEIGAVWALPDGTVLDRFESFVKPILHTELTQFCIDLTYITQKDVDSADTWAVVVEKLAAFARLQIGQFWGAWGRFDEKQMQQCCERQSVPWPLDSLPAVNLKTNFANHKENFSTHQKIRAVGLATALKIMQMDMVGQHHRALSDAINTARLLPFS